MSQLFVSLAILLPLTYGIIPLPSQPVRYLENYIKPADLAEHVTTIAHRLADELGGQHHERPPRAR